MIERYNLLEIKLLIFKDKKREAQFEELEKAKQDTADFRQRLVNLVQEFNLKQPICHLNLYGMKGSPCPTNIEEGDIIDSSSPFLN